MPVSPFNTGFFVLLAAGAALLLMLWLPLRNKSEKAKKTAIVILSVCNLALFIWYKCSLSVDPIYSASLNGQPRLLYDLLPLHLCNINLFLIPIGVLTGNKSIRGFCFFIGPIAAFLPLVFAEPAFSGYSLFIPRIFGYYVTHLVILVCCLLVGLFGFARIQLSQLPGALITLLILSLGAHGVNTVMRATFCPFANYFYTYDPSGISVLELLYRWIPLPYLYLLPALLPLAALLALICGADALLRRGKKKPRRG